MARKGQGVVSLQSMKLPLSYTQAQFVLVWLEVITVITVSNHQPVAGYGWGSDSLKVWCCGFAVHAAVSAAFLLFSCPGNQGLRGLVDWALQS